ncbi:MAG: hypothetical protein ABII26_04365 [Pseudomonadota bacterium]
MKKELGGLGGGVLNIAHEALDRHRKTTLKDKIALYWEGKDGESEEYTFSDLSKLSNRFANGLRRLGVREGESGGS